MLRELRVIRAPGAAAESIEVAPSASATPAQRGRRSPSTGPGSITRNAFDVAAAITGATSLRELDLVAQRGVAPLGFSVVLLGEIRNGYVRFLSGVPDDGYVERFVNCPTMTEDVVYRATLSHPVPFFWSDIVSRSSLTQVQRRMIEDRADCGYRDGLSSALPHRDGRVTFVALAGAEIDVADFEVRAAAHVLASCYGIVARRLTTACHTPRVILTPRQIDCLRWAREGKSTADIATILGISAHTAQEYITDACARLGVRTRVQAVAEALALNLIP